MHYLALQISKCSLQVITSYQEAAECTIYLPCFQNVLGISKISFQIAAECTNQRPYYQKFPDCGQPTSHPLYEINTCAVFLIAVIIHAKASLFQNDLCSTISFQIPSKYTIHRPCFHYFTVPNRFKCREYSPVTVFVIKLFSAVSNRFKVHPLTSLCSKFLCSSKSFQIPPVRMDHVPSVFSFFL